MDKTFIMLSGLPRSGSQVLASMLNQHPKIYASTTSPVMDLLSIVDSNWAQISAGIQNPNPNQYKNIINGVISGAHMHIDKPIIVDKNRLWPRAGKLMEFVLGARPKIICTVRDIPEIIASFIILINKNGHKITYIDQDLIDSGIPITIRNRCQLLLEKYINHPYTSLQIGFQTPEIDLCIVDYHELIADTQNTIDRICTFIGVESFEVALSGLQAMDENDAHHGGLEGLHHVRPVVARASPPPHEVIGYELTNYYTNMNLEFWKNNPR